MSVYWVAFIGNVVFVLGHWVCYLLFLPVRNRRKKFWRRNLIAFCFVLGLSALLAAAKSRAPETVGGHTAFDVGVYFFLVAAITGRIVYCCDKRPLFYANAAILARHAYSRVFLIFATVAGLGKTDFLYYVLLFAVLSVCAAAVYFAIGRRIQRNSAYIADFKQTVFGVTITVLLPAALLEPTVLEKGLPIFAAFCVGQSAACIIILCYQYLMYDGAMRLAEKTMDGESYRRQLLQSEQLREIIDLTNIRLHDVKQQVRGFGKTKRMDPGAMRELSDVISLYESFVKTGNDALDLILTEINVRCEAQKIRFSCVADGKILSFIPAQDLNALFGNALDNAIEYLRTVDEGDRYIFLSCSKTESGGFLNLRIENYFEGSLRLDKRGIPVTDKADALSHGFGMRSILAIAEKYGGVAVVKAENGMFKLHVTLPIPSGSGHFEREIFR
ncbi:MAG: ATP-binding protein [Clostridiales bacterium]|jgi:hypothetical protein|nr:ATP-binding protein [Clostridiales bacterium]